MTRTISRRKVIAAVGFAAVAGRIVSGTMNAQSLLLRGVNDDYKEDFFYRDDWLGEPWRKPEPVVLIHGDRESSVEWYAWVPRMAQEYRVIRPDLPGTFGHSNIPHGFDYSLASFATFVKQVMDRAGVNSAHIIGAKTGGAIAMRFAADYPKRARSLVVVSGPAATLVIAGRSPIPQLDRLGSHASPEMVAYWNMLFSRRESLNGPSQAIRSRFCQGGRVAAHHCPYNGDHGGPQQIVFSRTGAGLPGANSEFATGRHPQRRLPHRRG